jgi:hypothetical protein
MLCLIVKSAHLALAALSVVLPVNFVSVVLFLYIYARFLSSAVFSPPISITVCIRYRIL